MWIRDKNNLYNTDKFDNINLSKSNSCINLIISHSEQSEGGSDYTKYRLVFPVHSVERIYEEIMASLRRGDKFYDINEA